MGPNVQLDGRDLCFDGSQHAIDPRQVEHVEVATRLGASPRETVQGDRSRVEEHWGSLCRCSRSNDRASLLVGDAKQRQKEKSRRENVKSARDFFFFCLSAIKRKRTPPRRISPDQPTSFYTHIKRSTMSQTAQELPKELDLDDLIHLENM